MRGRWLLAMEPIVVPGLLSSRVNLAWQMRARVVTLDPGMKPAVADPPGFEGDRPFPGEADRIEKRDDVIVAVVRIVLAVVDAANDPARDEEVGSFAKEHRTASGITGRIDADSELVRAGVPDLEFVER